jgi:DNA-directed RNA polymerase specialized sigma24 family protein
MVKAYYHSQQTFANLARLLGKTEVSVKQQLWRIRLRLRDCIETRTQQA